MTNPPGLTVACKSFLANKLIFLAFMMIFLAYKLNPWLSNFFEVGNNHSAIASYLAIISYSAIAYYSAITSY